jgi:hypothetical protein
MCMHTSALSPGHAGLPVVYVHEAIVAPVCAYRLSPATAGEVATVVAHAPERLVATLVLGSEACRRYCYGTTAART